MGTRMLMANSAVLGVEIRPDGAVRGSSKREGAGDIMSKFSWAVVRRRHSVMGVRRGVWRVGGGAPSLFAQLLVRSGRGVKGRVPGGGGVERRWRSEGYGTRNTEA